MDKEADREGLNRVEYFREIVENRHIDDKTLSDYESEVERLRSDMARLQNEKQLILEQREEHTELVNTVKEEQSLAKRKANAGVLTRAKWWFVGMSGIRVESVGK